MKLRVFDQQSSGFLGSFGECPICFEAISEGDSIAILTSDGVVTLAHLQCCLANELSEQEKENEKA